MEFKDALLIAGLVIAGLIAILVVVNILVALWSGLAAIYKHYNDESGRR